MITRGFPGWVLATWLLAALAGPWLSLTPELVHLDRILSPPDAQAWLGSDDLGRDMGQRLIMGARTSLLVSVSVVSLSMLLGTAIGMAGAFAGGLWDRSIVHLIDIFLAFPGILLAIALAGMLGPGIDNVVMALALVGWVGYARLARAQTLVVMQREHVQAARALGSATLVILWRHILPLISAPLLVEASFGVAGIIIAEAGLSFLGLGVQPPAASWGSMIRDGSRYLLVAPHMVLVPGLSLVLVVVSVNLLGDRLRDHLDVRLRAADAS